MKDMALDDYQALALPETGLVPMRFLRGTITDRPGDIAGFSPESAMAMHSQGLAEPLKGEGKAPAAAKKSGPVTSASATGEEADFARRTAIVIPEDWMGQHHLPKIQMAKEISGEAVTTKVDAEAVIQAELDRRAKAA